MFRLVIGVLVGMMFGSANVASACTCVVNPDARFMIEPASKGMFATATVKDIRPGDGNRALSAVTVEITEPLQNAPPGTSITIFTTVHNESCGFEFRPGVRYVIESHYLESPSLMFQGVPVGSQIVTSCGKTAELNTPEGQRALAVIREAIRRLP